MIVRALLALALAGPAAAMAHAPQSCPWLNAGTAAKVLGAEVLATAHSDSSWSGSCRFVAATGPQRSIEVAVGKTVAHACASGATPIQGIGNRASLCSAHEGSGELVQTVSGRVRDALFVVTLTMPASEASASRVRDSPSADSAVKFLAEQVAGNLY